MNPLAPVIRTWFHVGDCTDLNILNIATTALVLNGSVVFPQRLHGLVGLEFGIRLCIFDAVADVILW